MSKLDIAAIIARRWHMDFGGYVVEGIFGKPVPLSAWSLVRYALTHATIIGKPPSHPIVYCPKCSRDSFELLQDLVICKSCTAVWHRSPATIYLLEVHERAIQIQDLR